MRTIIPTPEVIEECRGVIGYPQVGWYVLMLDGDKILGGELERPGEFNNQIAALPKYYPSSAERLIAWLDESGAFTELLR